MCVAFRRHGIIFYMARRSIFVAIGFVFFCVAATVLAYVHNYQAPRVTTSAPQQSAGERTYISDPPYDFSIDYPSDWGWITTDAGADGRNWQILFEGTTTRQNGIKDYLGLTVDEDTLLGLEGTLRDSRKVTINGMSALEGTSKDHILRFEIQILMAKSGHVYHFSLPAGAPTPMQVLETFKIGD